MEAQVRCITPDELEAWVETAHVAFHTHRPAAEEVAYRRDVRGQDLERTYAAFDGTRLVGTYESFPVELTLPGPERCATVNAISSVSVLPSHHRRGLLTRMLTHDLQAARERGEMASVLIAAEYPIYGRYGFGAATEQASYRLDLTYTRFVRSAEGTVDLVPPARLRQVVEELFDAFRRANPGQIGRVPSSWDSRLGLRPAPWRSGEQYIRCLLYTTPAGQPGGFAIYTAEGNWHDRAPHGRLEISDLVSLSADAYLALWRFCAEVDLLGEVTINMRRMAEPLPWLLTNARAALEQTARSDVLWLRPLDVPRFLQARTYATDQRLVLEVSDPLDLCGGRFVLQGSPTHATCGPTTESADLQLGMTALGAMSLGGVSPHTLHQAGLIDEERPGAVETAARLFHSPVAPWCSTFF